MRLLDRYQLRELLLAFGYCLCGILVFWVSFELLGEIEEVRERGLSPEEVALYLWHRLPLHLLLQIPVALLLSMLYVLSQHARHNELVAMRAAGVSLWRISVPYMGVGIALSGAMLVLNEVAVPDAAARSEAVLERKTRDEQDWHRKLYFRDELSGRTWSVDAFNTRTGELRGAHAQWRTEEGGREELIARRGLWEDNAWVFEGVTTFSFPPERDALPVRRNRERMVVTDFPETPDHLRSEIKISRLLGGFRKSRQVQLSLREILRYRELHQELSPRFDALLRTWFHDRLATPWTCVVVVLIAIPAAAGSGRRSMFVGVAAAVFLAFGFFVVKEFSLAAGSGGYLPAWLAAWLPNLVFGGLGVAGIQRMI